MKQWSLWRRLAKAAFVLAAASISVAGCGLRSNEGPLIARAGSRTLSQTEMETAIGLPLDSVPEAERRRWVSSWIERALVEQEAERRGLDKDADLVAKVRALRAEIYRARLLAEMDATPPTDSTIAGYYETHRQEFLRSTDAFLIELFWAEERSVMNRFREQIGRGDTTLLAAGRVSSEGKWLAERGELGEEFERELESLSPGAVTAIRPYEDGFRVARLAEKFPAGTVLDLSAVRDEIEERLIVEQSRARQDSLGAYLRHRYPVNVNLPESP
ncbi:peptidyl-prolyl cis-trans isomerase [bacterium]|nr:peptidyl-prolyl cis-trans isomerase [bacterium]MBU1985195.1 peptidyl-prolyl cis-trans isomerase [bacterium]